MSAEAGTVLGIRPKGPDRVIIGVDRPIKTNAKGHVILDATDGRLHGAILEANEAARVADARDRLGRIEALRPKDSREAGIARAEPRVEVELVAQQRIDELGRRTVLIHQPPVVEVRVFSLMKPGAFKRCLLGERPGIGEVMAAAGACCEECCEENRDPFDPDWAARRAATLFEELRR